MSVRKVSDVTYVVTDPWSDSVAVRFDGEGEVCVFRSTENGDPIGSHTRTHVIISRDDMHVILERYKETLS